MLEQQFKCNFKRSSDFETCSSSHLEPSGVSEGMLELIDCVPTIPDFRKRIMRAVSDTTHGLSHLWGDLLHVLGEGE